MIFQEDPQDWKELQLLAAKIFEEIECEAEVEKTIETARGAVEVDVIAKDSNQNPPSIILCECKFWKNKVPKSVVHSFRTVVSDFGANRGFIISKVGFQSGALEAAQKSNIVLVDWLEFQKLFYDRWVDARRKRLYEYADEIFDYMDVLNDRMQKIERNEKNIEAHFSLMGRSSIYVKANQWAGRLGERIDFPLDISDPRDEHGKNIIINNYREYFDICFSSAPPLIKAWKQFFGDI